MSTCRIQVKHPHGPICKIIEFLPEIEQVKMQGIDKNFYNKIIPIIQRQILITKSFLFPRTCKNKKDNKFAV